MKLKKEFIKRLRATSYSIDFVLKQLHENQNADINPGGLFPNLFKLYSYLWTSYKATKK